MREIIEKVRDRLENEKSNSNRFLLSNLYIALYDLLDENEKVYEDEKNKGIDFILTNYDFYDFLKNDAEIYKDFAFKIDEKFREYDFNYYDLFPKNKLNLSDAKDIVSDILRDINVDNVGIFDKLYDFDKLIYKDLVAFEGLCFNTFGLFDGNIVLDKSIDKMVIFIKDLVHEIGHNYENLFMATMSSLQQIDRYDYCFLEVCSSFFERVALDYMIRNRIYFDDANRSLNTYYCDLYDRLIFLDDVSSKLKKEDIIYDDEKVCCCDDLVFSNDDSDKKINTYFRNYSNDIKYGYGALLGEYFFDIYRKDKREGLKSLRNFLANQGLFDERQMLDSIDFANNDFSFFDKGLSDNMSYMRKRYKW